MKKTIVPLFALMLGGGLTMHAQNKITYPKTNEVNHIDDYFGTKIADPYRWLENDTAKETTAWVKEQNKLTQGVLSQIPYRDRMKKRITELVNYPKNSAPYKKGKYIIQYKNDGLQNQSVLYVKEGWNGKERVLLDPNTLSKDGTVALGAISFSPNQRYFAYSVSASGSDWQEIYIMDMKTGKLLKDKVEFVKFTGIHWDSEDGFYYAGYEAPKDQKTKYSAKTEYQKVYYHKLGTDASKDPIIYEDKDHALRYVRPSLTEDKRFLILNISEGTDGAEIKIKDLKNKNQKDFITIVKGFKTNAYVVDNDGDDLILVSNQDAPNYKVVKVNPKNPKYENWETLIAEKAEKLESVQTAGGKLFTTYLKDASSQVKQYSYQGKLEYNIQLPGIGTASGFSADKEENNLYYTFTSFTTPATIYKYNIQTGKSELHEASQAKFNPEEYETKQVFFKSKDGTNVPMFITHKKGIKLDGTNPTLLYGYGGFNISLTPSFSATNLAFIENGGIYVLVNLRGGGEYGESWHEQGMLENKQNVFDDFIGAAEHLIKERYTSSERLAIRGGSNGGLLVGAAMTQRPELFKVAIPQVGVLDMLRYHKFTVGWGWAVEYGSSDYEEQFKYLIKYSPLHNLKENTCYPATMITTADHDDRVVPAHSFKFAAELQKKQACDNPALIRIDENAGHGAGKPTSKVIEEAADIWSFIFYMMDYDYKF
ncbi:MAG TPA: prolyl oligopeptidase family serine peptidase [Chitinophagaceae bacterium]|nr:prolyl oligopeptidase family serine peptidase [Chitinophagaceae bacterium]